MELGKSVLSATLGVQTAPDAGGAFRSVVPVAAGGLLVVIAMRWLYFGQQLASRCPTVVSDLVE